MHEKSTPILTGMDAFQFRLECLEVRAGTRKGIGKQGSDLLSKLQKMGFSPGISERLLFTAYSDIPIEIQDLEGRIFCIYERELPYTNKT